MKTKILSFVILLMVTNITYSQLDANSLMGVPAVADTAEMTSIVGPNEGSIVYNQTTKNFYLYNGTSWLGLRNSTLSYGDIKQAMNNSDHDGWYLLNGRAISSLSTNAQAAANSLGFTVSLPNAQNRVLKHTNGTENYGDTGGAATTVLTQANLPNVNFTGNTSSNGNHNHTIPKRAANERVRHGSDANRNFFHQNGTTNTSNSGNHSHTVTVSSGGSNQAFERYQPYLVVNTFIYLGQ